MWRTLNHRHGSTKMISEMKASKKSTRLWHNQLFGSNRSNMKALRHSFPAMVPNGKSSAMLWIMEQKAMGSMTIPMQFRRQSMTATDQTNPVERLELLLLFICPVELTWFPVALEY